MRFARVLRETIDQLLDGQHTGRFRWEQLRKTEKTHGGTLVEINLQREFGFQDGRDMDYLMAGADVDCKFSQSNGGWEIPPEAWRGAHICLLVWAVDKESAWGAGLIRADDRYLGAENRDLKKKLTAAGRRRIRWIWEPRMQLPENVLLQLDAERIREIFAGRSGAERIRRLFRTVQCRPVGRGVIATVGQQADFMKRVRKNGGARSELQKEGIVILGQYDAHSRIARQLNLRPPDPGEFLSVRLSSVADAEIPNTVELAGKYWVVASASDPVERAPAIPYF